MGNEKSKASFRSSAMASGRLKSTEERVREVPAQGVTSMSRDAIMEGLLGVLSGRAYRARI